MGISDSDFFLVDDNGVSKKVRADKLKADRNNGTNSYSNLKLLINSADYINSNFIYFGDLEAKAAGIGWMLVNRSGQNYKTSLEQITDYFGIVLVTGEDITSEFLEISQRFIQSPSSRDYTGRYDVGETSTDFSGYGRVYIGVKVTSPTTYYNDVPIAGVQIVRGGYLVESWIFNTSTGGSGSGWQTYYNQLNGSSSNGFPLTPTTASGYSFMNMSTTSGVGRFSWAHSTGSSYTGAEDGISNDYKMPNDGGSGTIAPTGMATVYQQSGTYYAYRETSGSNRYSVTFMRSPSFNFQTGDIIKVIHAVTGHPSSQMNPDDTLYVGVA